MTYKSEKKVTVEDNSHVDTRSIDFNEARRAIEKSIYQGGQVTKIEDYKYRDKKDIGVNKGVLTEWRDRKVLLKFANLTPDSSADLSSTILQHSKRMVINEYIAGFLYSNLLFPTRTPHINLVDQFTDTEDKQKKFAVASVYFDFDDMVKYAEVGGKREDLSGLAKLAAVAYGLIGDTDLNQHNVGIKGHDISKVDHGISFADVLDDDISHEKTLDEKTLMLRSNMRFSLAPYLKEMPKDIKKREHRDSILEKLRDLRKTVEEAKDSEIKIKILSTIDTLKDDFGKKESVEYEQIEKLSKNLNQIRELFDDLGLEQEGMRDTLYKAKEVQDLCVLLITDHTRMKDDISKIESKIESLSTDLKSELALCLDEFKDHPEIFNGESKEEYKKFLAVAVKVQNALESSLSEDDQDLFLYLKDLKHVLNGIYETKDRMILNVNDLQNSIQSICAVPFTVIKESVSRACDQLRSIGLGEEVVLDPIIEYGLTEKDLTTMLPDQNFMDAKERSVISYLSERREVLEELAKDLMVISKIELTGATTEKQRDFLDYQWIHLLRDEDPVVWADKKCHKIEGKEPLEWAKQNHYQIKSIRERETVPSLRRYQIASNGHSLDFLYTSTRSDSAFRSEEENKISISTSSSNKSMAVNESFVEKLKNSREATIAESQSRK